MKALFTIFLLLATVLHSQVVNPSEKGTPLGSILDLFIASYAHEHIEWQRDLRGVTSTNRIELGRLLGRSALGDYTYRPASFNELTTFQREVILNDSRLASWIQHYSTRKMLVGSAVIANAKPEQLPAAIAKLNDKKTAANKQKFEYTISAEDMTDSTPLLLRLDSTK